MTEQMSRLLSALEQELSFLETHARTNKRLANETTQYQDMHDYFRGKEDAYTYSLDSIRRAIESSRVA